MRLPCARWHRKTRDRGFRDERFGGLRTFGRDHRPAIESRQDGAVARDDTRIGELYVSIPSMKGGAETVRSARPGPGRGPSFQVVRPERETRRIMTSPERAESNRTNARKSTGPKTSEGKARASRNAVTHGLTARAGRAERGVSRGAGGLGRRDEARGHPGAGAGRAGLPRGLGPAGLRCLQRCQDGEPRPATRRRSTTWARRRGSRRSAGGCWPWRTAGRRGMLGPARRTRRAWSASCAGRTRASPGCWRGGADLGRSLKGPAAGTRPDASRPSACWACARRRPATTRWPGRFFPPVPDYSHPEGRSCSTSRP